MRLLPLAIAIISTAIAQISYKFFFMRQQKIYFIISIGTFCLVPVMSFHALRHWTLSTMYMATGLTYVLVIIMANFLLGEVISKKKIYSIILIVSGVVIFNL